MTPGEGTPRHESDAGVRGPRREGVVHHISASRDFPQAGKY